MKIKEIYPDVITEDTSYEYKAVLNPDNPIKWAKTLIGYANDKGGTLFIGVSNDGEAFGIDLEEVDKTKLLISRINDRHIFPHIKISYMMRSVDSNAEHFVLAVKVAPADSVIRYREGDYNETVFIKGDGNATPATPEEIISLSKRKYGVDNETSEVAYTDNQWSVYLNLCKEYRQDKSAPTMKELQNEEIVSKDGYAKSGFIMFSESVSWYVMLWVFLTIFFGPLSPVYYALGMIIITFITGFINAVTPMLNPNHSVMTQITIGAVCFVGTLLMIFV